MRGRLSTAETSCKRISRPWLHRCRALLVWADDRVCLYLINSRPLPAAAIIVSSAFLYQPNLMIQLKVDPLLLEVADVVNTTLDLDTTLRRVAELVRKVIDYDIFAILLLNEKRRNCASAFRSGYPREYAERVRIKVGEGVTGRARRRRKPFW